MYINHNTNAKIPLFITEIVASSTKTRIDLIGLEEGTGEVYSKCIAISGEIVFKNGNIYKGELFQGKMHGTF